MDGTFIIERTPSIWGGVSHGVKGVKGWGRKLPHGVKGVKNSGGGVKIIGWGKTPCKSYPTL